MRFMAPGHIISPYYFLFIHPLHYMTCHLADTFIQSDYNKCIQSRVQSQNNKNPESYISSKKLNYKSTISKSQLSATEVLICFLIQI